MANSSVSLNIPDPATQADMETATDVTKVVTPGRQKFHPLHPKFYVRFTEITTTTISESSNVSSLTDNGTGNTTINFTVPFSSTTYAVIPYTTPSISTTVFAARNVIIQAVATNNVQIGTGDGASTLTDQAFVCVMGFGDQ